MKNNILSFFPKYIYEAIKNKDGSITDIDIFPNSEVWFKEYGKYQYMGNIDFDFLFILQEIAKSSNDELNAKKPKLDTMFNGVRMAIQIPPIVSAPSISIRIPTKKEIALENYVDDLILSKSHFDYIISAIKARKNIVVSGATESGKTTFMTAVLKKLSELDPTRKIIIIEDSDELVCPAKLHKKFLTSKAIGVEMDSLIHSAMRSDPDTIIVGEIRDFNALYLLQAWNTGHSGGITSVHANSVESTPYRILDLCMENEKLKFMPFRQLEMAVDVIISIESYFDENNERKRRVKEIGELVNFDSVNNKFEFNYIK